MDAPEAELSLGKPLCAGEQVLLIDKKSRRYLITLDDQGMFHTHAGIIAHTEMIGRAEGVKVATNRGNKFLVLRPTLSDYVLKMPRGAQVIYPKDLGPILMHADIRPGVRVLESGVGSGALSMALLRSGAQVTGYEIREDFANRALNNIKSYLGDEALSRYQIEHRDCYLGIDERGFDRVLLDLPEPWQIVGHAEAALVPGGIFLAYTPSVVQAMQLRERLTKSSFALASTIEVLERGWHIKGEAVRPDHRMVGHTGFLTTARLVESPFRDG